MRRAGPMILLLFAPAAHAEDPPASTESEDVLVITGTRTPQKLSDATVATEVITRQDIEASGARDVGDLLSAQTGLDVGQSFRGAAAEVRGLDPRYVLILVDGQRVTGRTDGQVDLSRFSLDGIEQIEIVKGPASALYGSDAIGGVINIRTRAPEQPWELGGSARLGTRALSGSQPVLDVPMDGLFPAKNTGIQALDLEASAGLRRDHLRNRLSASLRASGAYDLDPDDDDTNGSAWREYQVSDQPRWVWNANTSLGGDLSYRRRETRGVDIGAGGATYDQINLVEEVVVGLAPDLMFDGPTRVSGHARYTYYRDQFLQDQRGSSALDLYEDSVDQLTETGLQVDRVWGDHLATLGGELLLEALATPRLTETDAHRRRVALYAQDDWTLLDHQGVSRLTLLPGLRWDIDTQFGQHLSPKLSLRLDPVDPVLLRLSYGYGYRAPEFKELYLYFENPTAGYVVEGNPDLQPETSRSIDMNATFELSEHTRATLALFRNDIDNLIEPSLVADDDEADGLAPYRMVNIASAWTQGVEASLGLRAAERLRLDAGYAFLNTFNKETALPLDGRPPHRVTLSTIAELPAALEGTARVAWSSRQPYTEEQDGALGLVYADAITSINLRLGRRVGPLDLAVGVDNLLDAGDATYNRMAPRLVYASVAGRWPGESR